MLTKLSAVTHTTLARPAFGQLLTDADFNSTLRRITADTGTGMWELGGTYHSDSRHHYSKDQPWNDDGTLCKLQQKGGDPKNFVVSGATYLPLFSDRTSDPHPGAKLLREASETRWRPGYATQMVSTRAVTGGLKLKIWDVLSGADIWTVVIPSDDPGFGWIGEGQITDDGRFTVFTTSYSDYQSQADYIVVVDLECQRVGPRCDVSYATRAFPPASSGQGHIGNCGISPLGNYAEVKISGTYQYGFVLDIDKDTLIASRHRMQLTGLRMGSPEAQGQIGADLGCVGFLSHPDMNIDWLGRECVVGGSRGWEMANYSSNSGKLLGNVVMIDLRTGEHMHCSPGEVHLGGKRSASMQHGSGRAHKRRGWHLVSMEMGVPTQWGAGEVMWVRLDGSRDVERLCVHRSMETGVYRGEAHPIASPDGSVVMFASNWMGMAASGGVALTDNKAYVVTQSTVVNPPPPAQERYYVDPTWTYQPTGAVIDRGNGRLVPLSELARWGNERLRP